MMGLTSADLAARVSAMAPGPVAFGANCGVGASDLLRTILGFSAAGADRPVIAKGNAGIPKYVDGHIHYDGTPDLMARYAVMARDAGARIVGGCCGTAPEHLRAMRAALETTPRGAPPSLEAIAGALGAFSSQADGTGEGTAPDRPRRRRRRSS
jgi:5-methyltetrahydrofolate--homocysteine methyltransferase